MGYFMIKIWLYKIKIYIIKVRFNKTQFYKVLINLKVHMDNSQDLIKKKNTIYFTDLPTYIYILHFLEILSYRLFKFLIFKHILFFWKFMLFIYIFYWPPNFNLKNLQNFEKFIINSIMFEHPIDNFQIENKENLKYYWYIFINF